MTIKTILTATALLLSISAMGDERAITCHGCSAWQKEQAVKA